MRSFPVVPKSIKWLEPGDYWAIRLSDGRYGCGRVLQIEGEHLPTKTQSFFGGLHEWVGDAEPAVADVQAAPLVEFGVMHVRAIKLTGGGVAGNVPVTPSDIPMLMDSHGGPDAQVLSGVQFVRAAREEEWGKMPVLGYWGTDFIKELAEHRYAG